LDGPEALFRAGYYDGAGYLCGFVVKLRLKAAICARLARRVSGEGESRDALKTLDFDDLKLLVGIDEAFRELRDFDARSQ
jgi:hypothetical protein